MSQVISPAPLYSVPASRRMAHVIRGRGHAGLLERQAGISRKELAPRSPATHPNTAGVIDVSDDSQGVSVVLEQIDGSDISAIPAERLGPTPGFGAK